MDKTRLLGRDNICEKQPYTELSTFLILTVGYLRRSHLDVLDASVNNVRIFSVLTMDIFIALLRKARKRTANAILSTRNRDICDKPGDPWVGGEQGTAVQPRVGWAGRRMV